MSIVLLPTRVREDATALVAFIGPARVTVAWSLDGPGTLTPLSERTDGQGRAYARYAPAAAAAGTPVTISAEYGPGALPTPAVLISVTPDDVMEDETATIAWSATGVYGDLTATGSWVDLDDPGITGTDVTYSAEYPPVTPLPWAGARPRSGELADVYLQPANAALTLALAGDGLYGPVSDEAVATVRQPAPPLSLRASVLNDAFARVASHPFSQAVIAGGGPFAPEPLLTNGETDPLLWASADCPVTGWPTGINITSTHQILADHYYTIEIAGGMPASTGTVTVSMAADGGVFQVSGNAALGDPATPLTTTPDASGEVTIYIFPFSQTLLGEGVDATPGTDVVMGIDYGGGA